MFLPALLLSHPTIFPRAVFLNYRFGHPRWSFAVYARENLPLIQEAIRQGYSGVSPSLQEMNPLSAWYAAACAIAQIEIYRRRRAES